MISGPAPDGSKRRRIVVEGATVASVLNFVTVALALVFVFVLALRGELDQSSVTALYGGAIGHTLATAGQRRVSSRRYDDADG